MTFFPNTCLLLPALCHEILYLGKQSLSLEEIKPVSGKNLGIGALGMDNKEENQPVREHSGAESAECSAGCQKIGTIMGGRCTSPRILDHRSLTSPGVSQGLVGPLCRTYFWCL